MILLRSEPADHRTESGRSHAHSPFVSRRSRAAEGAFAERSRGIGIVRSHGDPRAIVAIDARERSKSEILRRANQLKSHQKLVSKMSFARG
jgi:hypothetical protein